MCRPPTNIVGGSGGGGVLCDLVPENVGDRGFSCDLVLFVEGGTETGRGGGVTLWLFILIRFQP